ncbi:MAG: ABC transporter ATP-binding protein [Deltaproteobacteria bacterium CG_4_8_14_3_um_filter_51_11]|nr:ATP-binding cassette domain-containing protein [bacterium]OIP39899.1 MAG: ABC transporter ATP-binding protein [Desulfobacteraceae bacterium CG2_30_51_40]PIP47156.1 MAG: ABC transporter ATP-binding protein [Deltaproteobacteria bacterium CG23_combo_of_CG06-09_8_20_14_all_51_20]PIX19524.1 MAG: ABC transporter ATP-binding protein [Deltaproteobacteria bacterium CG_4_8_14_3_um_filter_51_11]PIY27203.1 MAG: ABC transporter ATP-binding protein [Deltaproteobacteria bacterium CG_4_10_14_3_um_filter_51_
MIEVNHLSKYFGETGAVNDISFTVDRGEVLGFLGPNAAGKSTTMRMITGFLTPTAGTAVIGGSDIIKDCLGARRKIGYLPENAPAYPDMTVAGFLGFIAGIRGFSGDAKRVRVQETLDRCFLSDVRHQIINTLSKGYKQRVCFAQSILHDPEYLIMDEPTDGLDPNQKHEVRAMIRDMSRDKAIVISTHILEEVELVCKRVIIIARGHIVADDTPEGLTERSALHGAIGLTVRKQDGNALIKGIQDLPEIDRSEVVGESESDMTLRLFLKETASLSDGGMERVVRRLFERGSSVETFFMEKGRLDEVFRMVTRSDSTTTDRVA